MIRHFLPFSMQSNRGFVVICRKSPEAVSHPARAGSGPALNSSIRPGIPRKSSLGATATIITQSSPNSMPPGHLRSLADAMRMGEN